MTKFTPGPWFLNRGLDDDLVEVRCEETDDIVAELDDTGNRMMHDAHLIAAAPDLYEALEKLFSATAHALASNNEDDDGPDLATAITEADIALAKARGES